jgi:hypothetical protein
MAPDADDSTYLVDDRGAVSGRSCGGAGAVRLSWKFARLLVWIRWYCKGSDCGAYSLPSSRLCKSVRRSCPMESTYPVVSTCESSKPPQPGISSYPPIAESALLANERSGRKTSWESSSTPYCICGSAMRRLRLWKDKGALAAARSLASLRYAVPNTPLSLAVVSYVGMNWMLAAAARSDGGNSSTVKSSANSSSLLQYPNDDAVLALCRLCGKSSYLPSSNAMSYDGVSLRDL